MPSTPIDGTEEQELHGLGASFMGVFYSLDGIVPSSPSYDVIQWAQRCQARKVNADNERLKAYPIGRLTGIDD
jgi:hypothetical protein